MTRKDAKGCLAALGILVSVLATFMLWSGNVRSKAESVTLKETSRLYQELRDHGLDRKELARWVPDKTISMLEKIQVEYGKLSSFKIVRVYSQIGGTPSASELECVRTKGKTVEEVYVDYFRHNRVWFVGARPR